MSGSERIDEPRVVELRAGALRLALRPDLGACIAGLWCADLPVLASSDPARLDTAWPSACFALAPYSNRLGHRQFEWQGQHYRTALNHPRSALHSMHGVAWAHGWRLLSATHSEAVLEYQHSADADWPFAFSLRQRVLLAGDHLLLGLSLRNTDSRKQPAGLGWHPYFVKRAHSHLQIALGGRWDSDSATELPTTRQPHAGIDAEVAALGLDHCFDGWAGAARIDDEALSLKLTSSLPYLVVFTPSDKPFFCVEPVSHANNALNMADPAALGVRALAPGEAMDAWMRLDIALA